MRAAKQHWELCKVKLAFNFKHISSQESSPFFSKGIFKIVLLLVTFKWAQLFERLKQISKCTKILVETGILKIEYVTGLRGGIEHGSWEQYSTTCAIQTYLSLPNDLLWWGIGVYQTLKVNVVALFDTWCIQTSTQL